MSDDANIQLLLAKLPAESLARKLVAPFAVRPVEDAVKDAERVLAAVKESHLKEKGDGPTQAT